MKFATRTCIWLVLLVVWGCGSIESLPSAYDRTTESETGDSADAQARQVLLDWGLANGVEMPKLTLVRPDAQSSERSVFAAADIKEGEVVMRVPRAMFMRLSHAISTPFGKQLAARCQSCLSFTTSWMALLLVTEKRKTNPPSRWKPYLDVLPSLADMGNFPTYWTAEEQAELRGSGTMRAIEDMERVLEEDWAVMAEHITGFDVTKEELRWAYMCVSSRGFSCDSKMIDGELITRTALVPVGDMLNHATGRGGVEGERGKPGVYTKLSGDASDSFLFIARRDIARGEEVTASYGEKCNSKFLNYYGFAYPPDAAFNSKNYANSFPISFKLSKAARRRKGLSLTTGQASCKFYIDGTDVSERGLDGDESCFGLLRLKHLHGPAWEAYSLSLGDTLRPNPIDVGFIDIPNERMVWQDIRRGVEEALAAYPTSIEEDERLLRAHASGRSGDELSPNKRNAVLARKGEKEVAHRYLLIAELVEKWYAAYPAHDALAISEDINTRIKITREDYDPAQHRLMRYLVDVITKRLVHK